ncbi:BING4CT-domain-containing protein [Neoconidiobolus thromboides FSU 785]|nr:BING4CT-domain-containing protein [Neoconidiobolus thromboides FSU 785]
MLLPEEEGYLEAEGLEKTYKFTQEKIKPHVSISAASKIFDLDLDQLGPYKVDYTRNGKFILIGGRKGHVATFNWRAGILGCELQLRETVRDVKWLHNETMFAVAQKKYVYVYDRNGLEIHCLKRQTEVKKLDFLPYHFLLTSIGDSGILRYQDVSTGVPLVDIRTRMGRSDILTHNPMNAIVHLGHTSGTVSLWSPNSNEALVKMLCHKGPVQSISIDASGNYMATAGRDARLKIWDLRQYKVVYEYYTPKLATDITFSQRGVLAVGFNSHISLWKDVTKSKQSAPYMEHKCPTKYINDLMFCPFEDVLGVGHSKGFSSVLVPGSGEPNFDALELNPYQTKKQRQEHEVHSLLNKIQPDTIMLDSNVLGSIYNQEEEEKEIDKNVKVDVRYRARGKSSSSKRFVRKKGLQQIEIKKERARLLSKRKSEKDEKDANKSFNRPSKPTKTVDAAVNTFSNKDY